MYNIHNDHNCPEVSEATTKLYETADTLTASRLEQIAENYDHDSNNGAEETDPNLIVARNLLREAAIGVSAIQTTTRSEIIQLKKVAASDDEITETGKKRIVALARLFRLNAKKEPKELVVEIADILLEDMTRTTPAPHKTIEALAPPERMLMWRNLGLQPTSAFHEINEALSQISFGTQNDWRKLMDQYFRLGVVYLMNGLMGAVIAQDCINGMPQRSNVAMKKDKNSEPTGEVGFNLDSLEKHYGCLETVASALINGQIKGIVNISGSPDTTFDNGKSLTEITDVLLKNGVLIFTQGSASLPLLHRGYCSTGATNKCSEKLQRFLRGDVPPVWHFGRRIEAAHAMTVLREIAKYAGHPLRNLPFAELSLDWANEMDSCGSLAFRTLGINSYHCMQMAENDATEVMDFLFKGAHAVLGSTMNIEPEPLKLADKIIADFDEIRSRICWR